MKMQRARNFDPRLMGLAGVNWPQLCLTAVDRPNLLKTVVNGNLSLQPWFLSARDWLDFSADLSPAKHPEQSYYGNTVGGGDGWIVEEKAMGGFLMTPEVQKENEGLASCYATSYKWCCREQWVDLERAGYSAEIMDKLQPVVEITEWYGARWDCGSVFNLRVDLLDEAHTYSGDPNRTFSFSEQTAERRGGCFHKVQHQFEGYGKGVRYIRFADGGKDTQFWPGQFGSKMAGARVRIIFR